MFLPVLAALRRFRSEEEGSLTIETLIALPLLVWVHLMALVFFDAYHSQSVSVKAIYTLADALSREAEVTPAYMDGLEDLHRFLVPDSGGHRLRITTFRFNDDQDAYEVVWSRSRGGPAQLTTATLLPYVQGGRLPPMTHGDVAVMTEGWVDHEPAADLLDPFTYDDMVVTRPRLAPQLCWNDREDRDPSTRIC